MECILLISGPIAVGKSTITKVLIDEYSFQPIRSSPYLKKLAAEEGARSERTSLQELGDRLDFETDYNWVVSDVAQPLISESPSTVRWLFDCVRKPQQIDRFKATFSDRVFHTHLTASEDLLKTRYLRRVESGEAPDNTPYDIAVAHPNEQAARGLQRIADLVVHVDELSAKEVAQRIVQAFGAR